MTFDTTTYRAALYCRLSQDDGSIGESESIQTQKTLLTQYCKERNIFIVDCYCDDGWSGTNFERPDFKRMIEDIEAGKINMVIVKDLSRFGREYAQMGLYIEHYFEEKSVRFVAITENIDTLNGTDNLVLPFTNVINSFQARQTSVKTKAAFQARARSGMFLGSRAPFGYVKDPEDKHHLLVDPVAAVTVKRIFTMFAEGIGYVRMTKILRDEGVLNPQAYFNQNNPDYYKKDYWRDDFDWHATSIRAILNNEVYLGKTVFGKTATKGFYDKTRIAVPEEKRITVKGTHEAIISQELWDTVHTMMQNKRRESKNAGEIQMFAGLVKCADCGSALNVSYDLKKKRYNGFSCWVYKNYGKERCTSHAIGWVTLCRIVLASIQTYAKLAAAYTDEYLEALTKQSMALESQGLAKCEKEIRTAEKRSAELEKIIAKLYEDYALEKISEERYHSMVDRYEGELTSLSAKKQALEVQIKQSQKTGSNARLHIEHIRKYTDVQELDAQILNELIEKIVVHEKMIGVDGMKYQCVDIYYKYVGEINAEELLADLEK